MKRKIVGMILLAALSALCLVAAVACGGATYSVGPMSGEIAFLADPGVYTDSGSSISPIKNGETRTYDVILHNGYDRDTLKVYANGEAVTFAPNTTYNDDVDIAAGYQAVGSVTLTGGDKDIDLTFECEGKSFPVTFLSAATLSEADKALLAQFRVGGHSLAEYIDGTATYTLNYADVKDSFSFRMEGPARGIYEFTNNFSVGTESVSKAFMSDGEHTLSVNGAGTDLHAYDVLFFTEGLRSATGVTISVDTEGLYTNTWTVQNLSGAIVTVSESYFDATANKTVRISVDADAYADVDLSEAKLYINDTAVTLTDGAYSFRTAEKSPMSFLSEENYETSTGGDTTYSVRLEGVQINMTEGTKFVKVGVSTPKTGVIIESDIANLPTDSGYSLDFMDEPFYMDGEEWYYVVGQDNMADIAITINFSPALDQGIEYIVGVKYTDAQGMALEGEVDLTQVTFEEMTNAYQTWFAECSVADGNLSFYAVIGCAEGNITDSDCYEFTLCFTLRAGNTVAGSFR